MAIFKSENEGKVIILTDVVDYNKYPIAVIMAANKDDNCIASIYGRNHVVNFVHRQTVENEVLFMDLDRIECIKGDSTNKKVNTRLNEIKRNVLKSRGCKLKMTIERDGKKIELTEKEIWDAYNLVNQNMTDEIEKEAEAQLEKEIRGM